MRIATDPREGYRTQAELERDYAVVFAEDGTVDAAATARKRVAK